MGATILQIRDACQARIAAAVFGTNVGGLPTGSAPLPLAVVWPPEAGDYHGTFGDEGYYGDDLWTVTVYTARTLGELSVDLLLEYLSPTGPRSIARAFNSDTLEDDGRQTLGGIVDDAKVLSWRMMTPEDTEAIQVWGVSFALRIIVTKPEP